MSKPMIYTVPCGANAVLDKAPLEQDGSGAMKTFDGTGSVKGFAEANKDGENNVAMLTKGLRKLAVGAYGAYNVGDKLGINTSGIIAYTTGTVVGRAAETQSALATSGLLLVEVDISN